MANVNGPKASNAEIAEAMRAFSKTPVNFGFWGEVKLPKNDKTAQLVNQPWWSKAITGVVGILAAILFLILVPKRGEVMEPFRSNLMIWWPVLIGFVGILLYQASVAMKFAKRRESLFCKANGFKEIEMGSQINGDLRKKGEGIQVGYTLDSFAGQNISFGSVHGWFDKDHKAPKHYSQYSATEEECLLFAAVDARGLGQELAYFSPDRPVIRDQVPVMTDQAFQALSELARKYSVVIGEGSIVISGAGGSLNSATETFQFADMNDQSKWRLLQRIIGGKFADVVEGIS